METFPALLALCEGNLSVTGGFPSQSPVTRIFDVFFDLRLIKRFMKQSRRRWFETPSRSLWRHCSVTILLCGCKKLRRSEDSPIWISHAGKISSASYEIHTKFTGSPYDIRTMYFYLVQLAFHAKFPIFPVTLIMISLKMIKYSVCCLYEIFVWSTCIRISYILQLNIFLDLNFRWLSSSWVLMNYNNGEFHMIFLRISHHVHLNYI